MLGSTPRGKEKKITGKKISGNGGEEPGPSKKPKTVMLQPLRLEKNHRTRDQSWFR